MSSSPLIKADAPASAAEMARRPPWITWRRLATAIVLLAIVGITGGGVLWYMSLEAAAVAKIEGLGGRVRRSDPAREQGRVVSIRLDVPSLEDKDLLQFNPWWLRFPELRDLDLSGTGITDEGLANLRTGRFHALNLSDTRLDGSGLAHLADLPTLHTLNLNNTGIPDEALVHVQSLPNLSNLHLGGTNVTDRGLERLQAVTTLRYLQVGEGPRITTEGLNKLQEKMPDLSISRL